MALDTTISTSAASFEHCLSTDALGDSGASLSVQDAFIDPAPGPDYTLEVFDSSGTSIVTWGAGSLYDASAGHYPANSASSLPLGSGEYYTVLTTPAGPTIGCCFEVEALSLCEQSAPICVEFEGDASAVTFDFPITVGSLSTLNTAFTPLSVPDQFQILDDDGAVIYDSGLVTGSQLITDIDLTMLAAGGPSNVASGDVRVIIMSGGAAGTSTIFQLKLGCCEPQDCTIPQHDAVYSLRYDNNGCDIRVFLRIANWYRSADTILTAGDYLGYQSAYADGVFPPPESSSCTTGIYLGNDLFRDFQWGQRCGRDVNSVEFDCLDHGLPADQTITDNGTSVTMAYATAASYAEAEATFMQFDAWAQAFVTSNAPAYVRFFHPSNGTFAVTCGSDGSSAGQHVWYWQPGYITYDATNQEITYTPTAISQISGNCCDNETTVEEQVGAFYGMVNVVESWRTRVAIWGEERPGPLPLLADEDGWVSDSADFGISISSCADSGINTYTFRFNESDPVGTFELWRGPVGSGVLVDQGATWYFGSGTDGNGLPHNDRDSYIYLKAAADPGEGWVVQEVDYSTATFDLTGFGGGSAETFADGAALATRLTVLTGNTITHVPFYDLFYSATPLGQIYCIPVTQ